MREVRLKEKEERLNRSEEILFSKIFGSLEEEIAPEKKGPSREGDIQEFGYHTNYIDYTNIGKLLVNVMKGKVEVEGLEVLNVYDFSNGYIGNLDIFLSSEDNLYDFPLRWLYVEMIYNNVFYRMRFKSYFDEYNDGKEKFYIVFIYNKEFVFDKRLITFLRTSAYTKVASFKNDVILINDGNKYEGPINITPIRNVDDVKLEDIFIPEKTKEEVQKFIYCFRNYKKMGMSLKYLLSGDPGVGKTEVMRAIINSCKGYGNISVIKSVNSFSAIMDFVSSFELSMLCIDDIDMLLGNRSQYTETLTLKGFLESLDGIMKNNVFIISTTNDKKLVDEAATRPGRFSSIIDFGNIEPMYYMNLVKRVTKDEEILGIFDDELLERFEVNSVSGSFIVNFVKNITVMKKYRGEITKDDVMEYYESSYRGFYRIGGSNGKSIGFKSRS